VDRHDAHVVLPVSNGREHHSSETVHKAAPGPKERVIVPDADHVDLYERSEEEPVRSAGHLLQAEPGVAHHMNTIAYAAAWTGVALRREGLRQRRYDSWPRRPWLLQAFVVPPAVATTANATRRENDES
jgi:hypothetical protein